MPASASPQRFAARSLAVVALSAGLMMMLSQAEAATWGHLRSPWSYQSQLREWQNYRAEQREERRWEQAAVAADPYVSARRGVRRLAICADGQRLCAF